MPRGRDEYAIGFSKEGIGVNIPTSTERIATGVVREVAFSLRLAARFKQCSV